MQFLFFSCAKFPSLTQTPSSGYPLVKLKGTYTFLRSKITYNFPMERSPPGPAPPENFISCPPTWICFPAYFTYIVWTWPKDCNFFLATNKLERLYKLTKDYCYRCEKWWLISKSGSSSWFTGCTPLSISARGFFGEKFLFVLLYIV